MSLVSYAQNYEDVVLMRALRNVAQGFYVDVGAMSPELHSVTKAFYDRGWSGINVEPNPECLAEMAVHRPRDVNLTVAIGEQPGRLVLHVFPDTGLSTFDDAIAARHRESGWRGRPLEIEVVTLAEVWRRHVPAEQDVHFLKIDVEGFERQAIAGGDWERCRPWIVLVEATVPMTQSPSHNAWEPMLLKAGYSHAYSDGLNRFYVAAERAELTSALAVPPNVFDEFKTVVQVRTEQQLAEASASRDRLDGKLAESESLRQAAVKRAEAAQTESEGRRAEVESLRQQAAALQVRIDAADARQAEFQAILQSRSWRMTRPLRQLSHKARVLLLPLARRLLAAVWARAAASPRLKSQVLKSARRNRWLAVTLNRLRAQVSPGAGAQGDAAASVFARDPEELSAEAREILGMMRNAGTPRREGS